VTDTADIAPLKRTPLYELHRARAARMVAFAGYEMPVQYPTGIIAEHLHTRAQAGLFDVSHMGQIRLSSAGAARALEALVPGDLQALPALVEAKEEDSSSPAAQQMPLFVSDAMPPEPALTR